MMKRTKLKNSYKIDSSIFLVSLISTYILFSLAINNGSLILYLLAICFSILSIKKVFKLIKYLVGYYEKRRYA